MNYKNILVTGGAGFIGSNFVNFLFKNCPKTQIVVLDKLTYAGRMENLDLVRDKITFIQGDICDPEAVRKSMAGADAVVHFAAESHVDRSIKNPEIFVKTNVLGTQVLLEEALRVKVKRFHHISTDEVFGSLSLGSSERWDENSPYAPRSPYSASKAASDHLVRAYHTTFGLPVTLSNCANNIGPNMFPEKLVPLAVTNLLRGKKVPIYKPGNQVREWLYVEDHCSAITAVLEKGKIGETYFIGPNNPEYTNLEIVKMILENMGMGEEMIEYVDARPGHDQRYAMDHSKIERELGWKPKYQLKEALQKTIAWYKDNEEWWGNLIERLKD